jgi:hypothetical protein
VFFRVEHEVWKPMIAEWLEGLSAHAAS